MSAAAVETLKPADKTSPYTELLCTQGRPMGLIGKILNMIKMCVYMMQYAHSQTGETNRFARF